MELPGCERPYGIARRFRKKKVESTGCKQGRYHVAQFLVTGHYSCIDALVNRQDMMYMMHGHAYIDKMAFVYT